MGGLRLSLKHMVSLPQGLLHILTEVDREEGWNVGMG